MLLAGVSAAEADLGAVARETCKPGQLCFKVGDPPRAMVGVNAGTLYGTTGGTLPDGNVMGGAGCWIYLYEDGAGWHFDSVRCAQATGQTPGVQSVVWATTGQCANVREAPGLQSRVVDCLVKTQVDVDSAPVYADGHIWWHLANRGWMAHEFLVVPESYGKPS